MGKDQIDLDLVLPFNSPEILMTKLCRDIYYAQYGSGGKWPLQKHENDVLGGGGGIRGIEDSIASQTGY